MSERDYPSAESLRLGENKDRVNELVGVFENGIDRVLNGKASTAVLFEGDFIYPPNGGYAIDIGKGLSADPSAFFTKFIRAISQRGNIYSTAHELGKEETLEGETNGARYFRANFPNSRFPLERITYLVQTKSGPDLMIYSQKYYLEKLNENPEDKPEKMPILWRWVAQDNQLLDLVDGPTHGKEKVLIRV